MIDNMSTSTTVPSRTAVRRLGTIARWALRVVLAAQFAVGGALKLTGDAQMVDMFTDIGAGQWLRYLVGALELAGAAGLLIPRLASLAALGLVALMTGATVTNLLILHTSPALPIIFLVAAGVIAAIRTMPARRARTASH